MMTKNWLVSSILLCGLLITPSSSHAQSENELNNIGNSREWKNLLHYGDGWLISEDQSRADSSHFFISQQGKTDPVSELKADLEAFQNPSQKTGKEQTSAVCVFPARRKFLEKKLNRKFPDADCPKLNVYLDETMADAVQLVFSTAYPNNPGSMFGHTFLKFIQKNTPDLFQPSASYAAFVGHDDGFIYMTRGLFGGYQGAFDLTPYYAKINEYVRSESRDLWEYELNLDADEVRTLTLHLWELQSNAGFDYYFFDENCSYVVLRAIEVAKPEWNLMDQKLFTIPGSTVRTLHSTLNAIRKTGFRPSLRRKLDAFISSLDQKEKIELDQLMNGELKAEAIQSSAILDTAMVKIQYLKAADVALNREVQHARSKLKTKPIEQIVMVPVGQNQPEQGHSPSMVSLGGGFSDQKSHFTLGYKFAFHDLLNNDQGYEPFSQIDFPSIHLRVIEGKGLILDKLGLVAITSLYPWTDLEKSRSWKLALDIRRANDLACNTCMIAHGDIGFGIALHPFTKKAVTSFFTSVYSEAGKALDGARIGTKVEWLSVLQAGNFKGLANLAWGLDAFQNKRNASFWTQETGIAYRINKDLEVRATFNRASHAFTSAATHTESQLTLHQYF
jgi:hypothetical protein